MTNPIIDSHIHLWPPETANSTDHAWMTPGHILQRPHLLTDYEDALRAGGQVVASRVKGAIYVETDVSYKLPQDDSIRNITDWARRPLDEIRFLRTTSAQANPVPLIGLVPWAPLPQPPEVFKSYLELAETVAGDAWAKVRGFRYLVQFITSREEFARTVSGNQSFLLNLRELGRRGLAFEIAVDQNGSKATWQMNEIAGLMERTQEGILSGHKVTFIVNHLCKPDFTSGSSGPEFQAWKASINRLAKVEMTYMKLSGAFSELPGRILQDWQPEMIPQKCAEYILPWFQTVLVAFTPARLMFGSDWPVCTVALQSTHRGAAWSAWQSVVECLVETCSLTDTEARMLWADTAQKAYRLQF